MTIHLSRLSITSNHSGLSVVLHLLLFLCFFSLFYNHMANAAPIIQINGKSAATYKGKSSCGGKYPGSFLHVFNGKCYSCPRHAPKRTLNPNINSNRACKGPNRIYAKASYTGRSFGLIKTDCKKGSFLHRLSGKCYSCPGGYRRTLHGINSHKACSKKITVRYAKTNYRGRPGCPNGAFRHGLSDRCYACPRGTIRSASIGNDPSKMHNACVALRFNPPKLLASPPKNLKKIANKMRKKYGPVIAAALKEIPEIVAARKAGKDLKYYKPSSSTIRTAKRQSLKSLSLGASADGSVGIGGNGTVEFAHSLSRWSKIKTLVSAAVTAGAPGSVDGSAQIAFYTKDVTQLNGFSWAVEGGAGAGASGSITFIFAFTNTPGAKTPEFLGFVISGGAGAGVEADIGASFSFYL